MVFSLPTQAKILPKDEFMKRFITVGAYKIQQLEAQNKLNDSLGQSHLNTYTIYIDCPSLFEDDAKFWYGNKDASGGCSEVEASINTFSQKYNTAVNQSVLVRFYILYVNKFPVLSQNSAILRNNPSFDELYRNVNKEGQNKLDEMKNDLLHGFNEILSTKRAPYLQQRYNWAAVAIGTAVINKGKDGYRERNFSYTWAGSGFNLQSTNCKLKENSKGMCYFMQNQAIVSDIPQTTSYCQSIKSKAENLIKNFEAILDNSLPYQNYQCPNNQAGVTIQLYEYELIKQDDTYALVENVRFVQATGNNLNAGDKIFRLKWCGVNRNSQTNDSECKYIETFEDVYNNALYSFKLDIQPNTFTQLVKVDDIDLFEAEKYTQLSYGQAFALSVAVNMLYVHDGLAPDGSTPKSNIVLNRAGNQETIIFKPLLFLKAAKLASNTIPYIKGTYINNTPDSFCERSKSIFSKLAGAKSFIMLPKPAEWKDCRKYSILWRIAGIEPQKIARMAGRYQVLASQVGGILDMPLAITSLLCDGIGDIDLQKMLDELLENIKRNAQTYLQGDECCKAFMEGEWETEIASWFMGTGELKALASSTKLLAKAKSVLTKLRSPKLKQLTEVGADMADNRLLIRNKKGQYLLEYKEGKLKIEKSTDYAEKVRDYLKKRDDYELEPIPRYLEPTKNNLPAEREAYVIVRKGAEKVAIVTILMGKKDNRVYDDEEEEYEEEDNYDKANKSFGGTFGSEFQTAEEFYRDTLSADHKDHDIFYRAMSALEFSGGKDKQTGKVYKATRGLIVKFQDNKGNWLREPSFITENLGYLTYRDVSCDSDEQGLIWRPSQAGYYEFIVKYYVEKETKSYFETNKIDAGGGNDKNKAIHENKIIKKNEAYGCAIKYPNTNWGFHGYVANTHFHPRIKKIRVIKVNKL